MTTTFIQMPTRPGWSQRFPGRIHGDDVQRRMQALACAESRRIPDQDILVRGTDTEGKGWVALHWPVDGLAYWEFS